jgi:hypothetical protein
MYRAYRCSFTLMFSVNSAKGHVCPFMHSLEKMFLSFLKIMHIKKKINVFDMMKYFVIKNKYKELTHS